MAMFVGHTKPVPFSFVVDDVVIADGSFTVPMYAKAPDPMSEEIEIRCDPAEVRRLVLEAIEKVAEVVEQRF